MPGVLKSAPVINLNNQSRYRISARPAPPRSETPLRLLLVRTDACFNCGLCIDACVYGVHHRQEDSRMPLGVVDQQDTLCRSCLRCVRECPKDALSVPQNPEYKHRSYGAWSSEIISVNLRQAENGKVPVSGAGYRGKFAGPGFDGIWTDMSEIVRPTRDGIHGREYISSAIISGSRPHSVAPDSVSANATPVVELPVPFVMDTVCFAGLARDSRREPCARGRGYAYAAILQAGPHHRPLINSMFPCFVHRKSTALRDGRSAHGCWNWKMEMDLSALFTK